MDLVLLLSGLFGWFASDIFISWWVLHRMWWVLPFFAWQGNHITSGQPNGTSPSLHPSFLSKIYGTNCCTKGLSTKHSHTPSLLKGWQIPAISCLAAWTSIKLHSKPLTPSYGPAAERCLSIQNKAFKPASTDRHFYLWRAGYHEILTHDIRFYIPCFGLHWKCAQQETQHQMERALLSPARLPSPASLLDHKPTPFCRGAETAFCPKIHHQTRDKMGTAPNLPQEAQDQADS